MSRPISVAIIIPHKGRLDYLVATVESLFAQSADGFEIRIVVVTQDDNSEVRPAIESISNYRSDQLVIIEMPSTVTISCLRNTGVLESKADYLGFIDADVRLDANWVERCYNGIKSGAHMIVGACQRLPVDATKIHKIKVRMSQLDSNKSVQSLAGCNLFLSFDTFDKLGRFPEHLATCEDYYITNKAAKIGSVFSTGDTQFIHLGEDKNLLEVFRKEQWRALSNFASLSGRTVSIAELPSLIVPFSVLAGIVLLVLSIFFISAKSIVLALILLSPILVYSIKLYRKALNELSFIDILAFYLVYFIARALGMVRSIVKGIFLKSTSQ